MQITAVNGGGDHSHRNPELDRVSHRYAGHLLRVQDRGGRHDAHRDRRCSDLSAQ
jgi:hypothetical protein